jgi:hypothetical protein
MSGPSRPSAELRPLNPLNEKSKSMIQQWSSVLLTRWVYTIIEAKETLWTQFRRLFANEPVASTDPKRSHNYREEFESLFSNWLQYVSGGSQFYVLGADAISAVATWKTGWAHGQS